MFALLSPKLWIALALVAALAFSHFTVYRKGKADVRMEWQAATAAANIEAQKVSERRQRNVDQAATDAAIRRNADRARVVAATAAADSLRDDLRAARDYAAQSRAAAERIAGVSTELLERCTAQYLAVAEAAQRSDGEARELRQGWPR
jgi:hypothetical protein